MKKLFINKAINIIELHNIIDKNKKKELIYGIESIYLSISKLIIIILLATLLKTIKETFIVCLTFNILRSTGFGIHSKSSFNCLLSSIVFFIILPLITKYIILSSNMKILIGIALIILIYLFSPSDTKKRPLIDKGKRQKLKISTTIKTIILILLSFYTNYSNLILLGILIEVYLINPITYKIFNIPYNNYKKYNL